MNKFSQRRLKENEVIFRAANKSVLDFVENDPGTDNAKVDFYCECSMESCRQRIRISTQQYRKLHQSTSEFIVLAGHETPEIEKIIQKNGNFNVVEKFGEMPSVEDIAADLTHAATKQI